jgi:hypothetical protein
MDKDWKKPPNWFCRALFCACFQQQCRLTNFDEPNGSVQMSASPYHKYSKMSILVNWKQVVYIEMRWNLMLASEFQLKNLWWRGNTVIAPRCQRIARFYIKRPAWCEPWKKMMSAQQWVVSDQPLGQERSWRTTRVSYMSSTLEPLITCPMISEDRQIASQAELSEIKELTRQFPWGCHRHCYRWW